jgi:uncharacterized protein YjbJ (UPF0337 family)
MSKANQKRVINWNEKSKKLKENFSNLTSRDLDFEQGKIQDMIKRIENKTGMTKHEIYEFISKL